MCAVIFDFNDCTRLIYDAARQGFLCGSCGAAYRKRRNECDWRDSI